MHLDLPQISELIGPLCCERWHGCSGPPVWPDVGCLVLPSDVVWELESCTKSNRTTFYHTILLNLVLIKLTRLSEFKVLVQALKSLCVCMWELFIRANLWQFCLNLLSCVSEDLYCCFCHFIILHLQTLQQRLVRLS